MSTRIEKKVKQWLEVQVTLDQGDDQEGLGRRSSGRAEGER
jgi:hypothetical protein